MFIIIAIYLLISVGLAAHRLLEYGAYEWALNDPDFDAWRLEEPPLLDKWTAVFFPAECIIRLRLWSVKRYDKYLKDHNIL